MRLPISNFCYPLAFAVMVGCTSQPIEDPVDGAGGPRDAATSGGPDDAAVSGGDDLATVSNAWDLGPMHCTGSETFTQAQAALLSGCGGFGPMSCHQRAPFAGGLDLRTANAWAALVNVTATIAPAKLRVKPGDADDSFLVEKLTDTMGAQEGDPMPKGEAIMWSPPDPAKLNTLRCWIANGAKND
jgi:hypothetical protein